MHSPTSTAVRAWAFLLHLGNTLAARDADHRSFTMLQKDGLVHWAEAGAKVLTSSRSGAPETAAQWRARFPARTGEFVGPDMFTQKKWEDAVLHTFGEGALNPSPSKAEAPFDFKSKEECKYKNEAGVQFDCRGKKDDPAMRAMSVSNLRKVWKFIGLIADPETGMVVCPKAYYGDPDCTGPGELKPKQAVSMNVLNDVLVKPLTKYTELSLVGHIGGGKPDYFISHSWGGAFLGFLAAVEGHFASLTGNPDPETTYYWICTFANNQHEGKIAADMGKGITDAPFYRGIQIAKEVISVQDDTQGAQFTLRRAWCVFEMLIAYEYDKNIIFMCSNGHGFSEDRIYDASGEHDVSAGMQCDQSLIPRMFNFDPTEAFAQGDQRTEILNFIKDKGCKYTKVTEMQDDVEEDEQAQDDEEEEGRGSAQNAVEPPESPKTQNGFECLKFKMQHLMRMNLEWRRRPNLQKQHYDDCVACVRHNSGSSGADASNVWCQRAGCVRGNNTVAARASKICGDESILWGEQACSGDMIGADIQ